MQLDVLERWLLMKRRTLPRLLEPQSIIFGFTVFYFVWTAAAWLREPLYRYARLDTPDYHFNLFMATMLLVAAAGIIINRMWGKLLAALLCAQTPLAFVFIFWMTAQEAEATPLSPAHIQRWLHALADIPPVAWLWLAISSIILGYAVPSIVRAKVNHKVALISADRAALPPCSYSAQEQLRCFTTPATSAGLRADHRADVSQHRRAIPTGG